MLRDTGKKYNLGPDTQPTDPVANSLMGAEFSKANIRELSSREEKSLHHGFVHGALYGWGGR